MKPFLKVPIEMAQFALRARKINQVRSYLAGQLLYSGKCRTGDNPAKEIAGHCGVSPPTVYNSFQWLMSRKWMGKDEINGWYFFNGLDRIHEIEKWQFSRSVIFRPQNLCHPKGFFIAAVVSSAIKTGRKGTGHCKGGPESSLPVPVSFLQKTLSVSRRTAIRYFKIAKNQGFIDIHPNIDNIEQKVMNLTPEDVKVLRSEGIEGVQCQLLKGFKNAVTQSLRIHQGGVYIQGANLITSHLDLCKRHSLKKKKSGSPLNPRIKGDKYLSEGDKRLSQLDCNSP